MKSILTSVLLIICVGVFGQNKDTLDGIRLSSLFDSLSGTPTTISLSTPQKDTVDVIALVSDTSDIDRVLFWTGDGECFNCVRPITIKCKAVREDSGWINYDDKSKIMKIKEYLLPKKYIVWQSIIINKTK